MKMFDEEKLDDAIVAFDEIERLYPLSNEAIQAEIMLGFIAYVKMDYESSIYRFKKTAKMF